MRKETKKPAASSLSVEALENVADLYIRVSTTEQAEEGFSVEEQETRLRSYCEAYGYIINAVHVDPGYSGATLERPGIKEVIKDVRAGRCNKIIVWKLSQAPVTPSPGHQTPQASVDTCTLMCMLAHTHSLTHSGK